MPRCGCGFLPRECREQLAVATGTAEGEFAAADSRGVPRESRVRGLRVYTYVNWIRTSSYVKAWNRGSGGLGLVVIGVHAPEFEFGKHAENIDRGIRDHGLDVLSNCHGQQMTSPYRTFGNNAWPAKALFDNGDGW